MSEAEPIQFSPRRSSAGVNGGTTFTHSAISSTVFFTRAEFREILNLYGRKVAAGEWRDYAIDFGREKAVFSVFRHASEVPLYRVEKNPRLARRHLVPPVPGHRPRPVTPEPCPDSEHARSAARLSQVRAVAQLG